MELVPEALFFKKLTLSKRCGIRFLAKVFRLLWLLHFTSIVALNSLPSLGNIGALADAREGSVSSCLVLKL